MFIFMFKNSLFAATATIAALVTAFDYPLEISSPARAPADASWNVPHDFASFSWPAHWFADYAGNKSTPNLFSRDILDLLYNKTGAHPFIRVGGTSTDRVWYNESQEISFFNVYDPSSPTYSYGIADEVSVGDVWFEGFGNFPGTHWSYQVNMGKSLNMEGGLENALQVAHKVMDVVQDKLETFELGNEPELMARFHHRPENYTLAEYVEEWNMYADAVSEKVLRGNPYGLAETRFFQAFTIAHTDEPKWSGLHGWELGIDRGGHVKTAAFHQYAAGNQPWVRLQNSYMNHTANRNNITQWLSEVKFAANYNPPIPVVLGETNSNSFNLNMSQIEGVFGSALWLIDHLMMGMSVNMTRFNLIQGTTFGYSAWVPVQKGGRDPYVRAPLYGQVFVADMLGHHPEVQVKELLGLPWNMSAYGVYEGGSLAKYVVVNYDEWNNTTPYERPSQEVLLSIPSGVDHVIIERLTGNGANADEGIEWAGLSWNYTDGRLAESGNYKSESVEVVGGTAKLNIPSTEAVLVYLGGKSGSGSSGEAANASDTGANQTEPYRGGATKTVVGTTLLLAMALQLI